MSAGRREAHVTPTAPPRPSPTPHVPLHAQYPSHPHTSRNHPLAFPHASRPLPKPMSHSTFPATPFALRFTTYAPSHYPGPTLPTSPFTLASRLTPLDHFLSLCLTPQAPNHVLHTLASRLTPLDHFLSSCLTPQAPNHALHPPSSGPTPLDHFLSS